MSIVSLVLNLLILSFSACLYTYAHTIECSTTHCQNKFINCLPEEDCFVSCDDSESCKGAIINCPMNGNCNIHCLGSNACENTLIDATLSFGNLNVVCDDNHMVMDISTNHCKSMKIYGSIRPYTGSMNVMCNGNLHSCINSEINCPYHSRNCIISCNGDSSCESSKIKSPINGDLTVNCNGKRSCIDSIFNGVKASTFNINGCKADQSCFDLSLYCPPNINGHKKCFVEGNDNLGRKATLTPTRSPSKIPTFRPTIITYNPSKTPSKQPTPDPTGKPTPQPIEYVYDGGVKIFAINGWNDINIIYSGNFSITHYGTMLCGLDYNISCNLASNDWKCKDIKNKNDINCNDINNKLTPSPTINTNTNTNTKTPWPTVMLIHTKYFGNNHSILNYTANKIVINKKDTFLSHFYANPTVFVFILICVCIILCMFVGCAQARKDLQNAQNDNDNNNDSDNEQKNDSDSDSSPLTPNPIYRLRIPQLSDPERSGYSISRVNRINIIKPIDSYEKKSPYSIALGPMPKLNVNYI